MKKGRDVIGMSIVTDAGERLGVVGDVLIDTARGCTAGLVVRTGRWPADGVLAYTDVRAMGPDAVLARGDLIIGSTEWKRRGIPARRITELTRRHVFTRGGRNVGRLADVYFAEDGSVAGYDVEQAESGRIVHRRRRLSHQNAAVGEDAIIFADAAAADDSAGPDHYDKEETER